MSRKPAAKRKPATKHDWSRYDAMSEKDVLRAARSDPDAQPLTDAQLKRMKRPNAKVIRRAMDLSQEEFAERFHIPIGTLRDWEQGRVEPDHAARAYLLVIAKRPEAVREALEEAA
jgi:putative transcriptional regulator